MDVDHVVTDDDGSQGDAGVHVSSVVEVSYSAGVWAAFGRFEFIDDFHGADFWGAADGTGWQARSESVHGIEVFSQDALDVRRDMHDVRVVFDDH